MYIHCFKILHSMFKNVVTSSKLDVMSGILTVIGAKEKYMALPCQLQQTNLAKRLSFLNKMPEE